MGYDYHHRVRIEAEQLTTLRPLFQELKNLHEKIIDAGFWAIRVQDLETDGKTIYNNKRYLKITDVIYYFVGNSGQESKFLKDMPDELKGLYYRSIFENLIRSDTRGWKLYIMTELGVKEI